MTETMKAQALVVPLPGDASVLRVHEREVPPPGAGQVRVQVAAAGVNFIDTYQRSGVYPVATPFVLGMEGAGTVESVGEGVSEVSPGDRVAWAMQLGSAASVAVLPAQALVPVPESVELDVAAAAMLQAMTAHFLVHDTYLCDEGTVALVHAAAGGVGQLLVQLLKAKGSTVVATAGSADKLQIARSRGADHVIGYHEHDPESLASAVREAAGRGVDVVYDGVGQSTFDASLASLRPRGLMVLFGAASGPVPPVDPQRLNVGGSLYLTRPTLGHYIADRDQLLRRSSAVFELIGSGRLEIAIDSRRPLSEARAAYEALEGRTTTGKVLLVP
ncbi:quinone oxidoreductase family protein [Arsenicicoccus dermatophilus]|uniref:quinone oxidoreductase family protein n=1 Tax=Arsenicicoccus dermatophilus TaxID=1076331 RepID=UPI001F4CDE85|nr:quinone oxidoreductase [Arsenicicoccus dermatophilus]MCH8612224.1 quinone oxidoreductase [Arsenicicoccus dermatophilus]